MQYKSREWSDAGDMYNVVDFGETLACERVCFGIFG